MKGRQLIEKAMRLETLTEIPWVPFTGVHCAFITGRDSESFLKSKDLIVEGVSKAIELYEPDGIPVVFDLQLEAEALGCKLLWAAHNPPSVTGHPLAGGVEISELKIPGNDSGRVATVMEAVEEVRRLYPDIALYGLVTGPFTLALHLLGTDIFMKMFMEEDYVKRLIKFCGEVCKAMAGYYKEAGCDVIAVVDPMVSQIGTAEFEQFVAEESTQIFDHIRSIGALSSFFVCGDAGHNIEAMCNCRPDNISVDENISLGYVKEIALGKGISFGGNLRLTSTLLLGNEWDCEKDAVEVIDVGAYKGFILSPGCDLPYSTVINNLRAVVEIAKSEYRRDIVRTIVSTEKTSDTELNTDIPDMSGSPLRVDVITLDSASCAPCQYMMNAVVRAVEQFGNEVVVKEYKIKEREGLAMMKLLGVKKIPSICIAGKVQFSSNIPPIELISETIREKLGKDV
ncbi:MAG: uroporphyrinogen decarboxylase family protein [Bacteroidales bacterium]